MNTGDENFLKARLSKQFPHNEQASFHFKVVETGQKDEQRQITDKKQQQLKDARKQINDGRLKVVKQYMDFYSDMIKSVIRENNAEIYVQLTGFLRASQSLLQYSNSLNRSPQ